MLYFSKVLNFTLLVGFDQSYNGLRDAPVTGYQYMVPSVPLFHISGALISLNRNFNIVWGLYCRGYTAWIGVAVHPF